MQNKATSTIDEFFIQGLEALDGMEAVAAYKKYVLSGKENGTDDEVSFTVTGGEIIIIVLHLKRSFNRMLTTTYLPSLCLIMIAQASFYFPMGNFQV